MGYTQTYRANAAFSLYGVLKGYRDHGCKKATFINSFFTRYGAQTFVQALQLNGYLGGYRGSERDHQDIYADYSFTSVCHRELSDDDGGGPYMNDFAHPNSISYTLGCSSDLTFEIQSFLGARCVLGRFSGVYDELKEQNEDLGELGCALLYDSGSTPYNYNQQQDWDYDYTIDDYFESDSSNGGYDVDEENLAIVPEIVHPLDLIKYSQSCSIAFSAVSCPDPYGLVKSYYVKLSRATRLNVVNSNTDILKRNAAWILMVMFGVIMILFSFTLNKNDGMISKMPRRDYKIDLIDFEPPSYTRTLKKIGVFLENLIWGVIEFIVSVFELDVGEEEEAEKSHAAETAKSAKDVDTETGSAIDSVSSESESSDNSASFESKKSMLEGAKVNSALENPETQGAKRIGSANFEIPAVIGGSMVRCLSVVSTGTANSSVQVDSVKSHDDDIDNDRRKSASVVGAWKPDFLSISRSGSNMVAAAALSTSSHGRADAGSGGTQDVRGLGCAPILNTESQAGLEVELTPPHYLCATTTTREVDASKCPITSTSTRPRPSASTNKPPLAKGSTTASGKPPRTMRKKPPSPAVKSITTTPITRSRSQSAPANTASRTAPNEDHESSAHPPNTRAANEPSTVEQDIGTGATTEASQQPAAATEKPEEEKKQNEKGEWGGLIQCLTDGIIVQYPVKTDAAASEKHEEEKQNEKGEWGGLIKGQTDRIIQEDPVKTDAPFKRMMKRRFSGQNKK